MQQKVRKKSAICYYMYVCMFGEQHYIAKNETGESHCPPGILAIANAEGAPWKPAGWIITLGYYLWFNTISYWKLFIRLSKESGCIYN